MADHKRIGLGAGAVILLADLYWMYIAYPSTAALALGVMILLADLVWLFVER